MTDEATYQTIGGFPIKLLGKFRDGNILCAVLAKSHGCVYCFPENIKCSLGVEHLATVIKTLPLKD